MKPPFPAKSSSLRSLAAVALLATLPFSLAQGQDISGSVQGAFTELPEGAFSTPISAEENRRGAIGRMEITPTGALSLTIRFAEHVHHQTGVFILDKNSPPEDPLYVADLGETSGGLYLKAYRDGGTGQIALEWRDGDGNYVYAGFLMPAINRSTRTAAYTPPTPPLQPETARFPGVVVQHPYLDPVTGEPCFEEGEAHGFFLVNRSLAHWMCQRSPAVCA